MVAALTFLSAEWIGFIKVRADRPEHFLSGTTYGESAELQSRAIEKLRRLSHRLIRFETLPDWPE
jgi:hypothetical protein